jgi:DNA-binding NtrC family response regulator
MTSPRSGSIDQLAGGVLTAISDGERPAIHQHGRGRLVVLSGPDKGLEVAISGTRCSGGRSAMNELVLRDRAASGIHFEIVAHHEGYRLRDLDSEHGTFVGDLRVGDVYLQPGAVFRLGETEICFDVLADVIGIERSERDRFDEVLGASAAMRATFAQLDKVAPSELTCLITGETGTGKELVARAIHNASPRRNKPFVVLDCGAIPRELIESTLFGHEKGSFTGAVGLHRGCFEQAAGGTIFLDEIGELDLGLQPKLLRVLEQREIKRVGGAHTIQVDVRVVAATNRDLRAEVSEGNFREDLYFRLSVVHLEISPLRQRREDIPLIAEHFLRELAARRGLAMSFAEGALAALMDYSWPGNVRELRNVIERAIAMCEGPQITRSDLVFGNESEASRGGADARAVLPRHGPALFAPSLFEPGQEFKESKQLVIEAFETAYLQALLARNQGNITRAAQEAGLTRYHLRELLKRYQIGLR